MKERSTLHLYAFLVFSLLLILVILLRINTLYNFCFIFADSDQYVEWCAANNMHHGIFHEPCFYGQSYNPLFEPLFAQPLLFDGMPLRYALPIISSLFGFFPYVLLGIACFKQRNYISAIIAFVILLWLPIEFQVLTSIPRGFSPACAFASLGIYLALFTKTKFRLFWFGFFCMIAVVTSLNSVFLVFPVAVYLLLNHYKERKFYLHNILGTIAALPLPVFIYWFYYTHPQNNRHYWNLNYGMDILKSGIEHSDRYFNFLSPYPAYKFLTLVFLFILFGTICLIKNNFKEAIAIFAGLLLLLLSLSFDKSHDGTDNVFFSAVRMYLGIPLSFIIFCFWAESALKSKRGTRLVSIIMLSALGVFGVITFFQRNQAIKNTLYNYPGIPDMVIADRISVTKKYCDQIELLCKENNSSMVVLANWKEAIGINYMCSALNYPFLTIIPHGDRRTWVRELVNNTKWNNFIYFPEDSGKIKELQAKGILLKQINYKPSAWLVQTNGMKVFDILDNKAIASVKKTF